MNTNLRPLSPFQDFCVKFLGYVPSSYDECMTYLECLIYTYNYLKNEIVPTVETQNTVIQEMKDYIDNYFTNLDVQQEINNKLDEMATDGTLEEIITEYIQLKSMLVFDNVADMKVADNLIDGSFAKTLGYYSKNDGGMATYKVRELTNADTVDEATIIALADNTLIAELIVVEPVNVLQLGAKGDNSFTNDSIFAIALNKYKSIYIPYGTFKINNSITIGDNYTIRCDGTIMQPLTNPAIVINGVNNHLQIKAINSWGDGIKVIDTEKLIYNNEVLVDSVRSKDTGIHLYSTTNGIEYNNFKGDEIVATNDAIKIHVPSTGHHANENRFSNFIAKSVNANGVNLQNDKTTGVSVVNGNRFTNIGLEGDYNSIYLKYAWYNVFTACRSQEAVTNKDIIMENRCLCNVIQKDITCLDKLDLSGLTNNSFDNRVFGRINYNAANTEIISDELTISEKGLSYIPTTVRTINTYTQQGTDITLDGSVYTWILAKDSATIKLGYSYCNPKMIGRPITINTGAPSTIVDINNKTIIASDSPLQSYKNVKVTLTNIKSDTGECYWTTELL